MLKKLKLLLFIPLIILTGCKFNIPQNISNNDSISHYKVLKDFQYGADFIVAQGTELELTKDEANIFLEDNKIALIENWEEPQNKSPPIEPTFGAVGSWTIPDSTNYYSSCGDSYGHPATDMLDQIGEWWHVVNETHTLVLDMSSSLDITRVGLRGTASSNNIATSINIYVSDTVGTWGTAVATGIDPSSYQVDWLDTITTRKTGRYVKFEITSTTSSNNYIVWGSSSLPMIRIWDGDLPKRWTTVIPLRGKYDNNFSTTYTPTDGRRGIIPLDGSKYSNVTDFYLAGTGQRTGTSGADPVPKWFMEVYDRTNSAQLLETFGTGTSYETKIGSNGITSFPSGAIDIDARYKQQDSTSSQNMNLELHITQEALDSGNKTVVYIPLSSYKTKLATTYTSTGLHPVDSPTEYQFKYVASDWDATIDKVYITTTLRANTGNTVSLKLDDIAEGGSLASFTQSATTYDEQHSADIKASLVDGTTYKVFVKSTTADDAGDIIVDAYLVFEISDMNAFPTFQNVGILGHYESSVTGWVEDATQKIQILDNDTVYFSSDVTRTLKHQAIVRNNRATSMSVGTYDDGTRDTTADLTTTAAVPTWMESSAITPADGSDMTFAYNLQKILFGTGFAYSSLLIRYISDLGFAPVASTRNRFRIIN